jgi:hypothetical protein
MSRFQLAIGLGNQQLANVIWDDLQHMTATTTALSLAATNLNLGISAGTLGFFGATGTTQLAVPNSSNTTTIANALLSLGLVKAS